MLTNYAHFATVCNTNNANTIEETHYPFKSITILIDCNLVSIIGFSINWKKVDNKLALVLNQFGK